MRKILVDAVHQEETRLVVCDKGVVDEFEYQNTTKQSIKGNIYLAKTTRVEPSLQAVFVDYGQDADGFLPLSEINPEYFQIPVADKEKLQEAMIKSREDNDTGEFSDEDAAHESATAELYKHYKIQEVIKVGQVMLVQVKKEGRGKKGATLTTYISLAGRYCVLMPNAVNAGGVSRKIADDSERQRLRRILVDVRDKIGPAASVIIRTAGEHKTKTELKRDLSYLMSLWNKIREHTLASTAPAFIYEEGDVIQKAIRDLYSSEIEEILIEGEQAYKHACAFMEMLLPKHLNKIKLYKDPTPIFSKFYHIERQLGALYDNIVQLKSGGYLVINQTEALVAIDVNSGRATKERDIEKTALKINLEAAKEIARQLRLRDLSGLIVIDFIDMEELKNKRMIESAFKDAVIKDKAKINVIKISNLGMLEVSRQRLRPNFWEVNTHPCSHCQGRGRVRHLDNTSVAILRAIANEIATSNFAELRIMASAQVVLHTMNTQREAISALAAAAQSSITFHVDEEAGPDGFFMEKVRTSTKPATIALSAADITPVPPEEIEEENNEPTDIAPPEKNRTKRRWDKNGNKNAGRHSGGTDKKSSEAEENTHDGHSTAQQHVVMEDNAQTNPQGHGRKREKNRRNQHYKGKKHEREHNHNRTNADKYDDVSHEEDKFDQDMEALRKQHQSFLKEIWKKIVD